MQDKAEGTAGGAPWAVEAANRLIVLAPNVGLGSPDRPTWAPWLVNGRLNRQSNKKPEPEQPEQRPPNDLTQASHPPEAIAAANY